MTFDHSPLLFHCYYTCQPGMNVSDAGCMRLWLAGTSLWTAQGLSIKRQGSFSCRSCSHSVARYSWHGSKLFPIADASDEPLPRFSRPRRQGFLPMLLPAGRTMSKARGASGPLSGCQSGLWILLLQSQRCYTAEGRLMCLLGGSTT